MIERIQKALARANVASRRRIEEMILEGRVRLNGKKLTALGETIDPSCDVVHVNGNRTLTTMVSLVCAARMSAVAVVGILRKSTISPS